MPIPPGIRRLVTLISFALTSLTACADRQLHAATKPAPEPPVTVHLDGDLAAAPHLAQADFDRWVDTATRAISNYFGRYPVRHVDLHVHIGGRDKLHGGVQRDGRRIDIHVGRDTRPAD